MPKRLYKPPRLQLSDDEALDAFKQLRPFVELYRQAGMEGTPPLPISRNTTPPGLECSTTWRKKSSKSGIWEKTLMREMTSIPTLDLGQRRIDDRQATRLGYLDLGFPKRALALANQMRGLLAERGIVVPCGVARLRRALPTILEEEANNLSAAMREMLAETAERLRMTEERIKRYDTEIVRHCARDERCQRLIAVEGVGPLIATALVAAVGNAHNFRNGRELSAWLGLVPGHHESANREVDARHQQTR